jgi:hypothetical protein
MNINDAIKMLRNAKKEGVKDIVLAYWTADMFDQKEGDAWAEISGIIEDDMDWSMAHDQMSQIADLADV